MALAEWIISPQGFALAATAERVAELRLESSVLTALSSVWVGKQVPVSSPYEKRRNE
jgi:hypothetical protein